LPELSTNERRVYDAINPTETPIDQIASKCDLPSATVSSTLLALELKRLVKQLPGKYFVRLS
jgi:DNA processing protein